MLEEYTGLEEKVTQAGQNTVVRLINEAVDTITNDAAHYTGVQKEEPKQEGTTIKGSYFTDDPIDIIKEFGTGIVGSANPSTSPFLTELGGVTVDGKTYTKYDTFNHGEAGWYYPYEGRWVHTWGEIGRNVFTDTSMEIEAKANSVLYEELHKLLGG